MRLGDVLLGLAALLLAARVFTGIVVSNDSAEVFLVVKPAPSWTVTRIETAKHPLRRDVVIDGDEQSLVYEPLYVGLMEWTPALAVLGLAGALLLRRRGRRVRA